MEVFSVIDIRKIGNSGSLNKKLVVSICLIFTVLQVAFSQRVTRDNYTGNWETATSWSPKWNTPLTDINGYDIYINGFITCNGSLTFTGVADKLEINDTLVVYGDLTLANLDKVYVRHHAVLVVFGDIIASNQVSFIVEHNAYVIADGSYIKNGSGIQGSFFSYDSPSNVFITGTVTPGLSPILYPVFACPGASSYDNSGCSYGNLADLTEDPIFSFYQHPCNYSPPVITTSGPLTICNGESVSLTSGAGSTYLWSTGETSAEITVETTGNYSVSVADKNGCQSPSSETVVVTVNPVPIANAGTDQVLNKSFKTSMTAELSESETGKWSVISGNGVFENENSALTQVTRLLQGDNVFLWTVVNDNNCSASDKIIITVNTLPQVITPNGDGKNDFLIIDNGPVELIVYDRWGNEVFSSDSYNNDWGGKNNSDIELPDDTYLYSLRFANGEMVKGFVVIKR